ncbi:hypothetical protein EVAR_54553_1 [Eumeta japonica]|uniref:Uncharacterized protein n=1 Tax=Eumeta variegata TaxID=151549 RepID=A0A4C1YQL4_EUMVA|nr:hypothetical protein EVAR_54553_1 [Eumeta japonica]
MVHNVTRHSSEEFVCSWVVAAFFSGRRCGTEELLLPHARASPRRGYDPDGFSGDGPLTGVQFLEFSRFSRRSRGGVSGFTVIFLDRHGRLREYDEVMGCRSAGPENLDGPENYEDCSFVRGVRRVLF